MRTWASQRVIRVRALLAPALPPAAALTGRARCDAGAHDFLVDATVGSDLSMNPLDFADLMWKDGQRGRPRSLSN